MENVWRITPTLSVDSAYMMQRLRISHSRLRVETWYCSHIAYRVLYYILSTAVAGGLMSLTRRGSSRSDLKVRRICNMPFLIVMYSSIVTAGSLFPDLWLLAATNHLMISVTVSWWRMTGSVETGDNEGKYCPHTHTHTRLSEILVAQQGGCRESWSVLPCLQKCQQVKAEQLWKLMLWYVCVCIVK